MTRPKSDYVCATCGVAVVFWQSGWKHQNGGNSGRSSCGKKPLPMLRTEYDKNMADALKSALRL